MSQHQTENLKTYGGKTIAGDFETVRTIRLECYHVQHMTKDDSEYKRIMMMDQEGMIVTGLIFSDHLDNYATIFIQYHKYNISSTTVIRSDPRLHAYAESENLQNVRGIILQCLPSQEHGADLVTRRDIIIINEEKILLHVTLWKEFDEHKGRMLEAIRQPPLIFGLKLKVTTFNCTWTTEPKLMSYYVWKTIKILNCYSHILLMMLYFPLGRDCFSKHFQDRLD
ncbi:unnamed protein product [Lactuca virosa]|uniref:Uncharacterized protein n=1 Tax=Lactuca virosa TaxID=75947 RepID=A0AAU9NZB8_9ASTR|nr:unnamed protein product [Lactuca virosa]